MEKVAYFSKVSFDEYFKTRKDEIFINVNFYEDINCDDLRKDVVGDEYNSIVLPERATKGSAGYDFFAPYNFELKPGESITIPTGIRCCINPGWFLAIFPRSGFGFKTGYRVMNTVGIIDSDYYNADNEGHIFIKLENNSTLHKTLNVEQGQAFAQAILLPFGITIDDEADGDRIGGFGSTTINKTSPKIMFS